MSRKDNDSLEDFFRKATRHHDLQYNEADWKKLERMLDEQQPVRPAGWLETYGPKALTALAVVAGVVAILLLLPERQATDSASPVASGDTNSEIKATPQADESLALRDDEESEVTLHDDEVAEARDAVRAEQGSASQPVRDVNASAATARRTEPARASDEDGHQVSLVRPAHETNLADRQNKIEEEDLSEVSDFDQKQIELPAPAGRMESVPGAEEQVTVVQDQPADSASAETPADALEGLATDRPKFDATRGRFGISVVAAPDFSMTPKGGAMGAGDAMGVFLHYQVLPRWGVTAGVLYENKKYWGKGDEYRPPYGYWKALTNGVVPDRIDGTCAMYEVPVSVTFDIVSTRRTRLFASAGLASYFMRSEEYYYHFDTPNPGAVNGWTGKKPATLWFGIGTLSAGFDFRATRTLSLGIEPYLKVPLEGMGWADVDLYSTGVMFAARYHFAKKANKHPPTLQGP